MNSEKVIESVKFLLNSVSKLSDRFLESKEATRRSFENVKQDIDDLLRRMKLIEDDALNWRDQQLVISDKTVRESVELPIKPGQEKQLIPAVNLPTEAILETYRNNPVLLQPFSRPCSISGRTLSGMIDEIEIEVFAQGSTWIIETQDGNWLVLPKPGMLTRRSQMQSLSRLFQIEDNPDLPAELEILEPGSANVVEHGRRWYLAAKGRIGLQSDPLQLSLESRLKKLEQRLRAIEERSSTAPPPSKRSFTPPPPPKP